MKCNKCGKEFSLALDLEGKYHKDDEDYYKCVKCKNVFCKEHLTMEIINKDKIFEEHVIEYYIICKDCKK